MSEKSYVSLGQKTCFICGKTFDSGEILLDKNLRNTMEKRTDTGTGTCPDDQTMLDDGYVALIGADPSKSTIKDNRVTNADVHRTGHVVFLKRHVYQVMFNIEEEDALRNIVFVDQEVIDLLKKYNESTKQG